jgi:hypothetical protein
MMAYMLLDVVQLNVDHQIITCIAIMLLAKVELINLM